MEVSNMMSVEDFKKSYISKLEEDIALDNIRMFAMGKELKNDLFLYSYDIMNESTV